MIETVPDLSSPEKKIGGRGGTQAATDHNVECLIYIPKRGYFPNKSCGGWENFPKVNVERIRQIVWRIVECVLAGTYSVVTPSNSSSCVSASCLVARTMPSL